MKKLSVSITVFWILGLITLFWIVLNIFGTAYKQKYFLPGNDIASFVSQFCFHSPYLIGLAVLTILWAAFRIMSGQWNLMEIIRGVDNRWSTSKCQFFLWTIAAIFSYTSVYAALVGAHYSSILPEMPTHLLLAMGLSVTTALAAKGITVSQTAGQNVNNGNATLGDLVNDDGGEIDLTKLQMLGWTVIALGAYLGNTAHLINQIEFHPVTSGVKLPDIDTGLMVLMGLGQGAYLAKKVIAGSTVTISAINPSQVVHGAPDTPFILTGQGFGTAASGSVINIDGKPETGMTIQTWQDSKITFTIPAAQLTAAATRTISLTIGTQASNSVPLTIT
jgi:hypothetical protein